MKLNPLEKINIESDKARLSFFKELDKKKKTTSKK